MSVETFGHLPDGTEINRISLTGDGLSAKILTYGAILQDLRLQGHEPALTLGFENLEYYLLHSRFFGATAGRCANRIQNGHLVLNGKTFQLDRNYLEKHHLHGGRQGIDKRVWQIAEHSDSSITLSIELADGEMGYPGNMTIKVTFSLLNLGVLDIEMSATTDQTTLCNLAHHSYFNLDGSPNSGEHLLWIDADNFLPVDVELIPTGEIRAVGNTDFDFRKAKRIGEFSDKCVLDHNFCLSAGRESLRLVAGLKSPTSSVTMDIKTTEPGLQVFDGALLNVPVSGLDGCQMGPYAGIALEPQIWPDANHHPDFPQAILQPGETYQQHTQYIFSKETT